MGESAALLALSLPSVSRHVKLLHQAGLITQRRDAQRRICRLELQPLTDLARWAERFGQRWGETYQRLDGFLAETAEEGRDGDRAEGAADVPGRRRGDPAAHR